jgi:hypothetical protein
MNETCAICGDSIGIDILDDSAYVILTVDFLGWKPGDEVGPLCIDCLLDMTTQKLGEVKGRKNV